ncbi:MAG: cryptochrome/photolyase family protein [Marinagarivorans sp.]
MRCLRLILGDQLNINHSWFNKAERSRRDIIYVLMEVRSETDYVVHHAQKILGIFAAMRAFAAALHKAGLAVHYLRLNDEDNQQDFVANLAILAQRYGATHLERQHADEYRLEHHLSTQLTRLGLDIRVVDSEHFLLLRQVAVQRFAHKTSRMEFFYRDLRKRYAILLDEQGKPLGGQWNYDQDNRKRWNGKPAAPNWYSLSTDLSALWQEINHAGVKTLGEPQAEAFPWPIRRSQAKAWLAHFCQQSLPQFGEFQDAMSTASGTLFHAGISFALNIKLLHPMEVLQAALQEFNLGRVSLPTIEGFVRQILGWREYVRAIYWARMPGYAQLNYLQHFRPLPRWFWDGKTHMRCVQQAIGQSLNTAYAHHIQRLMVTGNFALLAGCDPAEVDAWYLGIYIDAFEWVEMPNTRGMSQYADGGILGSKPYVSSASYINKMSDYCQDCVYNAKRRHGEGACPFNSLYWHFYARHKAQLSKNPRIGMAYVQWQKMPAEEQQLVLAQAQQYLDTLDNL